jgi:hypothetical protein
MTTSFGKYSITESSLIYSEFVCLAENSMNSQNTILSTTVSITSTKVIIYEAGKYTN